MLSVYLNCPAWMLQENGLDVRDRHVSFGCVLCWVCCVGTVKKDSNLVDSASSHTLVSKIKPCMSKYKSFTLKLRTAHYISYSLFDSPLLLG